MDANDSIIINTYDRPEPLSRCLEAVSRQARLDEVEVIVVDDGSRGNFDAISRLWARKMRLKFIKMSHGGPAAARNRGVEAARGERIIFLGDDVMVRPGWLAAHLDTGRGNRLRAVLGPYRLEKNPKYSAAFQQVVDPVHFEWIRNPEDAGYEFFFTGNISMDRALFHEIGGFDERFPHAAWEDVDLGLRFSKSGGKIIFCELAKAVHEHPQMTRGELWEREFRNGISHWIFFQKWGDEAAATRYWGAAPHPGPAWRRDLGKRLVGAVEHVMPGSPLLPRLYERVIYSCRHAGIAEGMRRFPHAPVAPAGQG